MLKEDHEYQCRGVWVPSEVLKHFAAGTIRASDVILLALVDTLVTPSQGCYASNEWLGERLRLHPRSVRERVSHLKGLGLLKQVGFDGKYRYLETAWSRAKKDEARGFEGTKTSPERGPNRPGAALRSEERKALFGATPPNGASFGLTKGSNGHATETDQADAERLLEIVRGLLGPSHHLIRRARTSVWANHLRLLREQDATPDERRARVLEWYGHHIGEEFVPEAYAGESFRRKFFAIERQMERDVVATVEPGQHAKQITARLAGMGWPKGSGESVSAAVQACLNAYQAWLEQRSAFLDKLRRDDLAEDYGAERKRLLKLGQHLIRTMPSPDHFVEQWMRAVYERVKGWEDWSGDFGPFVFKPRAKRFQNMGRGWAESFAHDPDRWSRFTEVMIRESE